jgi:putative sigma-54 modulation protein
MKLIVSGKNKDFTPELEEKFGSKIAKLGKFIEQRGEREAHVTHQLERHLHKVEIVINFYDHALVGEGLDADLDTALCHAVEKIEKQIIRLKNRWRDTHRAPKETRAAVQDWNSNEIPLSVPPPTPANDVRANGQHARPKIFRVDYSEDRKPMTLDEAILDLERDGDGYVVYRDARKDCLSVLIRRADGNIDLIES